MSRLNKNLRLLVQHSQTETILEIKTNEAVKSFRTICNGVSNKCSGGSRPGVWGKKKRWAPERFPFQADKLALLAIILLLAGVSPTYSTGLPQGNAFLTTYNVQRTNNKKQ